MTAQRILVERGDTSVAPSLRQMLRTHADDRARLHALWTLDGLGRADRGSIEVALTDRSAPVRAAAIRVAEPMLAGGDTAVRTAVMRLMADRDPSVRRQLAASVGELEARAREDALREILKRSGDDPIVADLVVSALAGRELVFLERLLGANTTDTARTAPVMRTLTRALVASRDSASIQRVLVLAGDARRPRWQRLALLDGSARPTGQRGGFVIPLSARPRGLLAAMASPDIMLKARAAKVAESLNWPGKRDAGPAVHPLTAVERARYATGHQQYLTTCSACHQPGGIGLAGVAKPLVGSPWVLGRPERLIRILLHGKEGAMLMPPIGAALSNEQVAAVLTYVRRSWGNSASAVDAAAVLEVRGATTGRKKPWTEEELQRVGR